MKRNKWLNAAIPAILLHICIGSVYAWSLFVQPIALALGVSVGLVQFAFSLAIFFLGMSAAFGGSIVEKNIHRSSLISIFCFCGGLCLAGLAVGLKSLILLYLGYGCLMGIGLGIGYLTPVKTLMLWFKDNKGLATGISVCAFGFASTLASPIITFLMAHFALPIVFLILAGIYFIPMLIGHFLLKKPEGWIEPQTKTDFKIKELLKDKNFIFIWLLFFLNIACGLALIPTASLILGELGFSVGAVALVVSIMGIFNGAGRLVFSAASDKLKERKTIYYIIFLISMVCAIFAFYFAKFSVIALILISACYGAGFSCIAPLLSDLYGMKHISKIHGTALSAWAIAGLVGNQITTLVHSLSGSYLVIFPVIFCLYYLDIHFTKWIKK